MLYPVFRHLNDMLVRSRVPQLVVTRMGRNRPWLLAFSDFVQLVRVCPRLEWRGGGVARRLGGVFRRAVAR